MIRLKKYVLITGASRGIGRSIALTFAKNNVPLVLVCKSDTEGLKKTRNDILNFGGDCRIFTCDVSKYEEVAALGEELKEEGIHINGLINNAGISLYSLIQDTTIEEWHKIIDTNLSSVFYMCKTFVPHMISEKNGRIINISSVWGNCGASFEVAYSASKGGVNSFTKGLAKELAPSCISVNAIACGAIDTSMNDHLTTEEKETLEEEIPYCRMGLASEVAQLAYQLYTSPDYLTGQIITMDGGWT